jgi:hypothetical protein
MTTYALLIAGYAIGFVAVFGYLFWLLCMEESDDPAAAAGGFLIAILGASMWPAIVLSAVAFLPFYGIGWLITRFND